MFWKNRNILITGITGFIGSNIAKRLIELGANVVGITRTNHKQSLLFFEKLDSKIKLVNVDLCDLTGLIGLIGENRIDCVFHLAAQVEVGIGMSNPYLTFESNTRATYTLLEAIRLNGAEVKSVIVASTDKSYGSYPSEKMPYEEDFPLLAKYPYDVSKACADVISQSYANEFFSLPIVVTRFSNIFGPGQLNFSALIPDLIRSALGYSIFEPRGDGSQKRDFLYIDDVVSLYLLISKELSDNPEKISGQIFNAGTEKPTSVSNVIDIVNSLIPFRDYDDILQKMKNKKTVGEIDVQFMSHQKVLNFFNWKPNTDLKLGIEYSIEWYKKYFSKKN